MSLQHRQNIRNKLSLGCASLLAPGEALLFKIHNILYTGNVFLKKMVSFFSQMRMRQQRHECCIPITALHLLILFESSACWLKIKLSKGNVEEGEMGCVIYYWMIPHWEHCLCYSVLLLCWRNNFFSNSSIYARVALEKIERQMDKKSVCMFLFFWGGGEGHYISSFVTTFQHCTQVPWQT